MAWTFTIRDMGIIAGRQVPWVESPPPFSDFSEVDPLVRPPWERLEGIAEADDGRCYAWEIATLDAYQARADWLPLSGATLEPFPELGRHDLFMLPSDAPIILVDAPSFDQDLIYLLQDSPPELRPSWLTPMLTDEEEEWLDDLEAADLRQQVPLALNALADVFGAPVRIEAGQAMTAAHIMLVAGFVLSPDALFREYPGGFSTRARQLIRTCMEEASGR